MRGCERGSALDSAIGEPRHLDSRGEDHLEEGYPYHRPHVPCGHHADLLVIGEESDVDWTCVLELESALGREVQLMVISYYRWEAMKSEGDRFAESVLRNHVLIKGVEL